MEHYTFKTNIIRCYLLPSTTALKHCIQEKKSSLIWKFTYFWEFYAGVDLFLHGLEFIILVSFFNGISTFMGYLMPKPSFLKNRSDAI